MEYRNPKRSTSNYVWFKTLDADGKVLKDYPNVACFAQIASTSSYSGYGMHKNTATIHIYRSKSMMPYEPTEIQRWINDLNELGFPCRFVNDEGESDTDKQQSFVKATVKGPLQQFALKLFQGEHPEPENPNEFYNFYVDLKDYSDKSHLFSTLSLIRMLSESYFDDVPEKYFQMLDENPTMDKFEALQNAHKNSNTSSGHCVTYSNNGENITLKQLMSRFKQKSADLWSGELSINECWRGKGGSRY